MLPAISTIDDFGLRLLLTDVCNLQCVFCHDEFQGGSVNRGAFDFKRLRRLFDEAADLAPELTIKLSGGEPLLKREEVLHLITFAHGYPAVGRIVLITNLQTPIQHTDVVRLAAAGLTDVRANVPSFAQDLYRCRVGRNASLTRLLERLAWFQTAGVRTEATCVVDAGSEPSLLDYVLHESKLLDDLRPPISLVRFVQNAHIARSVGPWAAELRQAGFDQVNERCWQRLGSPALEVTACDDWSTSSQRPTADWYIQPPGRRLTTFKPAHAPLVRRGDLVPVRQNAGD